MLRRHPERTAVLRAKKPVIRIPFDIETRPHFTFASIADATRFGKDVRVAHVPPDPPALRTHVVVPNADPVRAPRVKPVGAAAKRRALKEMKPGRRA